MAENKITGNKIYLRTITYDDTDLMVKWRNQDNVRRFFLYRETFTREIHENWMKTKVETGEVVQFIICDLESDTPIGCTYLRDIDNILKSAEYGVLIGEESYRGHGIGKEALALTLKYAFKELDMQLINSRVISDNGPSLYCFINSGFEISENTTQTIIPDGGEAAVTKLVMTREKYEELNNNTRI